jgi:hypothetical protein
MGFFSRLLQYQARPERTPFEDFLTEVLAEWLRQVTAAGQLLEVLKEIFRQELPRDFPASRSKSIEWTTQHTIGPGHPGIGKRPDLVGQGEDFFLIIEDKIAAGIGQHEDESGRSSQLETYARYRESRPEKQGGIVLLTHYTSPPDEWKYPVVGWQDIHQWCVGSLHKHHSGTRLEYVTRLLIEFLEDQSMTGARIALNEIIAIPAYDALTAGCEKLGKIAGQVIKLMDAAPNRGSLKRPRGGESGKFSTPNYFGEIRTPDGKPAHNADTILWCGVLARPTYEIEPRTVGLPELSVGIAFWGKKANLSAGADAEIEQIAASLKDVTNLPWTHKISDKHPNYDYGFVRTDRSFIEVYQEASGGFWDKPVKDFLTTALQGIAGLSKADIQRFLDCFK